MAYNNMESFVGLLTTNTVGRWLGACVEEDIFSLKKTSIADVLHYTEDENNHGFLARRSTLFEALDAFGSYEQKGRRLEVSLLGIITIWDLPRIHEELAS